MSRTLLLRGFAAAVLTALTWLPASAQTVLVLPYVQPGDGRTLTGSDVKVLRWLTDQTPGAFVVEYTVGDGPTRTAKVERIALDFAAYKPKKVKDKEPAKEVKKPKVEEEPQEKKEPKVPPLPEKEQHYFRYTAHLGGLPFNSAVRYRVKLGVKVVREATFRTRATADKSVRCVLVGDMAQGRLYQQPIAYQISQQKPDFLVALGDIVYPTGRAIQYMAYFWPTYNDVKDPSPKTGAPLMATVPFYPVLGNHDIGAKLPAVPDALAAYLFFAPPKGGPGEGPWATKLGDNEAVAAKFRAAAADSYPNMDAYSFDYGPAHFAVLNVNKGMAIHDPAFLKWLRADLQGTSAKWKIVCFHQPGFQSSKSHYAEQQVRTLQPLFEECGVDLTFGGHVHNYQRTVPLKFAPDGKGLVKGKVNGTFTLDTAFDGKKVTQAQGVIHIVAGGGGASLYGPGIEKTLPYLKKTYKENNYVEYTAKMIVDRHSFVVLDLAPEQLELRAVGANGDVLDQVTLTKGK